MKKIVWVSMTMMMMACGQETEQQQTDQPSTMPSSVDRAEGLNIRNGTATGFAYREVVRINIVNGPVTSVCTGTIFSPHAVITAAHCVEGRTASEIRVLDIWNTGTTQYSAKSFTIHSDWHPYADAENDNAYPLGVRFAGGIDLAVINLTTAVPFPAKPIAPSATTQSSVQHLTIGYGASFTGDQTFIKRSGYVNPVNVYPSHNAFGLDLHQYGYMGWIRAGETISCGGDSGGPVFNPANSSIFSVVSRISGSPTNDCSDITQTYHINVTQFRDWAYTLANVHQNPANKYDVNKDGNVSPVDMLQIVNYLNAGSPPLNKEITTVPTNYLDVSGDGVVTSLDILLVVNCLNGSCPQ